jgi:hypothetical protein
MASVLGGQKPWLAMPRSSLPPRGPGRHYSDFAKIKKGGAGPGLGTDCMLPSWIFTWASWIFDQVICCQYGSLLDFNVSNMDLCGIHAATMDLYVSSCCQYGSLLRFYAAKTDLCGLHAANMDLCVSSMLPTLTFV